MLRSLKLKLEAHEYFYPESPIPEVDIKDMDAAFEKLDYIRLYDSADELIEELMVDVDARIPADLIDYFDCHQYMIDYIANKVYYEFSTGEIAINEAYDD